MKEMRQSKAANPGEFNGVQKSDVYWQRFGVGDDTIHAF